MLVKKLNGQPAQGRQIDGHGDLWCAVAETTHGKIPGKAKGDTCWYPHQGQEVLTKDFSFVVEAEKGFSTKPVVDLPVTGAELFGDDGY